VRSISAETWTHLSIHRSGWRVRPWSNSRCTTHINAKYTHAFARARPRANACTLVIILHTHVRVVRGVVLRPPTFPLNTEQQPPFPRCNPADHPVSLPFASPARLSTVLHVVPTRTICFIVVTWSPPPFHLPPFSLIWRHAVTNHIMFAALTLARRKDYFYNLSPTFDKYSVLVLQNGKRRLPLSATD